jgi:Late embryogenesis abundant protein
MNTQILDRSTPARPSGFSRASTIFWVLALGFTASLGGCNKAIAPTFKAMGVREIEHENDRSVIEFSIEATNPNKEPIPLRRVYYAVELDGVEVYSGMRSPQTTLHTYSSHLFTLPAVIPGDLLSNAGEVEYRLIGRVEYIPPGRLSEVLFDAEMKVPEAPMDISGTINTGVGEHEDDSDTD